MNEWYVTDKQGNRLHPLYVADTLDVFEIYGADFYINTDGDLIIMWKSAFRWEKEVLNPNEYNIEYHKTDPTTLTKNLFNEPSVTEKMLPNKEVKNHGE